MLKVVSSMKDNNALICTAILKSVFEEEKKSNITLLKPFIIYIVKNNPSIEMDEIKQKMEQEFAFYNLPHSILKMLINKLTGESILKRENNCYTINSKIDISKKVEEFERKLHEAKKETLEVLKALQKFLYDNYKLKYQETDCKNALSKFLSENGYILYEDINAHLKRKKRDSDTYYIGKFIEYHQNQNDSIFEYLTKIIEGSLLANALYVNAEGETNENLKKVSFYLDTTLILRILECKLPEDNKSAQELISLLKSQGAKLKCFRHTFQEVENIIEDFGRNIGKVNVKTLENFVLKKYDEHMISLILSNLEKSFKNHGIEIVETEEYTEKKYKYVISQKELAKRIQEEYEDKTIKKKTIDNDVSSISSIMLLRENKKVRKLEDCKAIFVTTNNKLKDIVNNMLDVKETFQISPAISDLDITAIVWLKSLSNNKDFPKTLLIENARAALQLTPSIKTKIKECIDELNNNEIDKPSMYSAIYNQYFREKIMEETGGDVRKINTTLIADSIESAMIELKEIKKDKEIIVAENNELKKEIIIQKNKVEKIKKDITNKYKTKSNKVQNVCIIIEKIISIIIGIILIILSCQQSNNKILKCIGIILGIYSAATTFLPINTIDIYYHINKKINPILFSLIEEHYKKKEQEELKRMM